MAHFNPDSRADVAQLWPRSWSTRPVPVRPRGRLSHKLTKSATVEDYSCPTTGRTTALFRETLAQFDLGRDQETKAYVTAITSRDFRSGHKSFVTRLSPTELVSMKTPDLLVRLTACDHILSELSVGLRKSRYRKVESG